MGGGRSRGTNSPANLLHLCLSCHVWIEARRCEALEEGLLVRQYHDPATTPVLLADGWKLLTDDGGTEAAA
jgi:hypothetical protein